MIVVCFLALAWIVGVVWAVYHIADRRHPPDHVPEDWVQEWLDEWGDV